jgi:hypothetical protein
MPGLTVGLIVPLFADGWVATAARVVGALLVVAAAMAFFGSAKGAEDDFMDADAQRPRGR